MIPTIDVGSIVPMIVVATGVLLLPLAEVLLARRRTLLGAEVSRERRSTYLAAASAATLLIALILTSNAMTGPVRAFNLDHSMIQMDRMAHFLNAVVLIAGILTVLVSSRYLADVRANFGEFYALVLSSIVGMMFLAAATNLLLLFLALELMSIPLYALAGFRRDVLRSNESALKYLVMGSFASAILLYGIALLYGATGSIALEGIGQRLDPESPLAMLGAGLVLIGLAFKVSAVPFHQWAPDTYEGAPTSVTGFMATAVKVAAFGALARVVDVALLPASDLLYSVLWVLAALTMTVGNVMAIIQQNAKRMLAYSSIAHAGYILVGVLVGGTSGTQAVLFYLLAYTFMTIGAFSVVSVLARGGDEYDRIEDLAGLAHTRPFLATVMAICMFSLLGIPATAGFMGKFGLVSAAVKTGTEAGDTGLIVLAILTVLNSAVSLVYYLRVPAVMFMGAPKAGAEADAPGTFEGVVLAACAAAILLLGLFPQDVLVLLQTVDATQIVDFAASTAAR